MKKSEAIERYETIARGGITGSFEHVESLFAEAVGRGVPWDPEVDLHPCPNPECVLDEGVELERSQTGSWVQCEDCSMVGPYSNEEAEAIRLWNLLPRTQDEVPAGDPGERELPERLCMEVDGAGVGIIDQADRMWLDLTVIDEEIPLSLTEREKLKELLARYNLVESLNLGKADERDLFGADVLRKWLAEEREKLR